MFRLAPILAATLFAQFAYAEPAPTQADPILPNAPKPGDKDFIQPNSNGKKEQNIIDEATLRANPQLLAKLLDQAISTRQFEAISALLPLYEEAKIQDQQLLRYARAAMAQKEGRTKDAISLYRSMLAEDGNLAPVRLQLAMALAADRQDGAAEDQFVRLRSNELPPEVLQVIDHELDLLQKRHSWSFNFSAYYQADDNINDAPPQQKIAWGNGTLTFPTPIKAQGLHYYLSADKTFPLSGGSYSGINASISGDYWNRSEYNDMHISAGTTLGWHNTRNDIHINPFIRRRIFAGKAYSTTIGANISANRWITPQWQLTANAQISHAKHDERDFLDGNQYYAGVNALYVADAGRYLWAGAGIYRNATDDTSDTYNRPSINLGWGEEWSHGISSRLSATVAQRNYAGPDFFNIIRKDKEYSANLSLWKRDWHFWGITPKLNLEWQKSSSNHFYYDGKHDSNAYIEFSKTF